MDSTDTPADEALPQDEPRKIPSLPHVVWRCIASHLADDLPTLLHVASFSTDLRDIRRLYISAFFKTVSLPLPPIMRDLYCHRLLQLVLEGFLDPVLIEEFYCWADYYDHNTEPMDAAAPRVFFNDTNAHRVGVTVEPARNAPTPEQSYRFDRLLEAAVQKAPFIPADMKSGICVRFFRGDPHAALAVLLPLCAKLKMLEIPPPPRPPIPDVCATVVQNIAQEYQRQGISAENARRHAWAAALNDRDPSLARRLSPSDALPFPGLLVLTVTDFKSVGYSYPLAELIAFKGIPPLHRIVIEAARDHDFPGWPADMVRCSCPEIWFQESSVTRRAVMAFAEGVRSPCEIRQWFAADYDMPDSEEANQVTWDRTLVETRDDGSRSVTTRLEFDGGNPGYDQVSWLWHGKMRGWRRLDEKFKVEDGDFKNEWGGSLDLRLGIRREKAA